MKSGNVKLEKAVVKKPWGYEYLVYQNESVALWCLHIDQGQATSLHCHPNKKTGLILLSGEATLSFLNDSIHLKTLGRLILRPGLFHSTKAISPDGITLLELETPVDKGDLVRFEDTYGREKKPYEGKDQMQPLPKDFICFREPKIGKPSKYKMGGSTLFVEKFTGAADLEAKPKDAVIAVLDGGLVSDGGEPIVCAGDVGSMGSLLKLAGSFKAPKGISLLIIRKDKKSCHPHGSGNLATADLRMRGDGRENSHSPQMEIAERSPNLGVIPGLSKRYTAEHALQIFKQTCINHCFELQTAEAFNKKLMKMPVYLSLGQEHIPAAISSIAKDFMIFAQHRAHSYYLSFGGDEKKLVDELLHRPSGCAGGMGGSASIHSPEIGMFGHSGLMGDQIPIAVGAALGSGKRTLAVTGDASVEEDYVFGAMGYAVTKKLPVLFICEDNDLSILTHVATRRSWSMVNVAESLGMQAVDIADDPWLIAHYVETYLKNLPAFINIRTCRQRWHSGAGTDGPPEWNRFELFKMELKSLGLGARANKIEKEAKEHIAQLWQKQLLKP
jgi:acetoin:2,6-dichlorophenolindophenol oxidoreductase subunit alpha